MAKKSDSLLRGAIADAKEVRETALANARIALEEAFTPHLTSMLAARMRNEADDEDEDDLEEGEEPTAADGHGTGEGGETDKDAITQSTFHESAKARRLREAKRARLTKEARRLRKEAADVQNDADGLKSSDIATEPTSAYGTSAPKDPAAAVRQTSAPVLDNKGQETMGEADDPAMDLDQDLDQDDMAGAGAVEDEAEVPADDAELDVTGDMGTEPEEEGRDMDLEAIIKELEADIDGGEEDDLEEPVGVAGVEEDDVPGEELDTDDRQELDPEDEMPTEGAAGTQQTDAVADGHGSDEGGDTDTNATVDSTFKESKKARLRKEAEGNDEEDIDLDEILKEIEDEEDAEKSDSQVAGLTAELKEYRTAVKFLRSKLNEVNLLNAKLLYTNRLFRDYNMDVRSKMRVVESFDRATSVREAKLVYATMAETFRGKGGVTRKVRSITEGMASRKTGSTAPKGPVKEVSNSETPTILLEGTEMARRFKKLAGIKK